MPCARMLSQEMALKAKHEVLGCVEMVGVEMVADLVSPVMLRAHTLLKYVLSITSVILYHST